MPPLFFPVSDATPAELAEDRAGVDRPPRPAETSFRYVWTATIGAEPSMSAPSDLSLTKNCQTTDASLNRAAKTLANRALGSDVPIDAEELTFALRASGSPYPRARMWMLQGAKLTPEAALPLAQNFLRHLPRDEGSLRCGVGFAQASEDEARGRSVHAARETDDAVGRRAIVLLASHALAELVPLPISVRSGSWLGVQAVLASRAEAAELVVLGPSGVPYGIPVHLSDGRAQATLRIDRPGRHVIQLLASSAWGPRPLLEAWLFADRTPPPNFVREPVPGEDAGIELRDASSRLATMVAAARKAAGLVPLTRSAALDHLAREHAAAMRRAGRASHDLGDGNPDVRAARSGFIGAVHENVASAPDLRAAHRLLWQSPAHRKKLLDGALDSAGFGVAVDPTGTVYVCELFANLDPAPLEIRGRK